MRTLYIPRQNRAHQRVSNPLFKMTKLELDAVINPILLCLEKMKKGTFTGTDWYNIMFFLMVGEYIVKNFYTEDTIEEFMDTYRTCEDIEERAAKVGYNEWTVTPKELENIEAGIEAVVTLQSTRLRLEILKAHRYAKETASKRYIKRRIMSP